MADFSDDDERRLRRLVRRWRLLRAEEGAQLVNLPLRTLEDSRRNQELPGAFAKIGRHIRYCPLRLKQNLIPIDRPRSNGRGVDRPVGPLLTEQQAAEIVLQIPQKTLAALRKKGVVTGAWKSVGGYTLYRPSLLKRCFFPLPLYPDTAAPKKGRS